MAKGPISVNLLASTPFTVAVGGTQFNENGQDSTYWKTVNGSDGLHRRNRIFRKMSGTRAALRPSAVPTPIFWPAAAVPAQFSANLRGNPA